MLIEDVHFRLDWHPPEQLGYKAVAVNLSDIAAMGGRPLGILVSLGCRPETSDRFLEALYQGMLQLCDEVGISILGGDTCKAERLTLCITALGISEGANPTTLSGARPGEAIFSTGCPGLSALGLRLLERFGPQGIPPGFDSAVSLHLRPVVPWEAAAEIAQQVRPGAMTDLSDGLARDVGKICLASGVGARIDFSRLPWHKELLLARERFGWNPVDLALYGGEDYCLLFTVTEAGLQAACDSSPQLAGMTLFPLGEVTEAGSGLHIVLPDGTRKTIEPSGFDHFKTTRTP
jgi:thiamine-monophosphate kinase